MISDKASRLVIAKFIVVGMVAFFVNYAILELALRFVTGSKPIAATLAMVVTINLTYILHTKWTYFRKDVNYYMSSLKWYLSYLSTNSTGAVITIVGFSILTLSLPNLISLGIAATIAMIWNFLMNLIVWRHNRSFGSDIKSILK